jgi:DNA helicase-2/ATP-dependent DNA helicase PcrA
VDPEAILAGLNDEQRVAAMATKGPVVILAGAGTGKTRVISHRVAYAAATKAIDPKQALVVTFTEKAATEMRHRLQALGLPQVQASTFHAAARRQLAHFWPLVHGTELPEVLDSKLRIIGPLARGLPGGYKFTPAKDLADAIEWAKVRRQRPETYAPDREPPVPPDVFRTLWRRYEQAKSRANRIDFEDMLTLAVELYETDADALALAHRRYSWFSVDEYQDTNRLQEDLLRLWLGGRRDLCVVGDPDQTIYSFTGASSEYLATFADRYPGARVVRLGQNYRSTPQVLALANRLIPGRELRSSTTDGPIPELVPHADGDAEVAAVVARIHRLVAEGVPLTEIAILVRTNAQLVGFEAALTAAEIPFTVRGVRFFARPDVRAARASLRPGADGRLTAIVIDRWRNELGFDEFGPPGSGAEARDRHAALSTLLAIARSLEAEQRDATVADYLAELARRDAAESEAGGDGVTLSTLHRAKGLEWDAVFLPQLEEGTLPIRQAFAAEALAEERRLLYVGITRARRHLVLSWAGSRLGAKGPARARPSRFIAELRPNAVARPAPKPGSAVASFELSAADEPLLAKLIEWRRERARADGVPAYVVADNKTLAAIAARRPMDEAGLLAVRGIGPQKVASYGAKILAIVRSPTLGSQPTLPEPGRPLDSLIVRPGDPAQALLQALGRVPPADVVAAPSEAIWGVVDGLTPRQAKIVSLRFGRSGQPQTLSQISTSYGLTPERIRQILKKAIKRLNHPSRRRRLWAAAAAHPRLQRDGTGVPGGGAEQSQLGPTASASPPACNDTADTRTLAELTSDHLVDILRVTDGSQEAGILALLLIGSPAKRAVELISTTSPPWVAFLSGFDYRTVREQILELARTDPRMTSLDGVVTLREARRTL